MAIRIVRLGTPRTPGEGLRLGTVRRPPRGAPRADFARRDYYDCWLPELAPSEALVKQAQAAATPARWQAFRRKYLAELRQPAASRILDLLAGLSHTASLSLGCYCEDESRCHRSVLREVLMARKADIA